MKRDEMMLLVVVFLLGYFASRMFPTEGFSSDETACQGSDCCTAEYIGDVIDALDCDMQSYFSIRQACGDAVSDDYQGQSDCDLREAVNAAIQQHSCQSFRILGNLPVDTSVGGRCDLPPRTTITDIGPAPPKAKKKKKK